MATEPQPQADLLPTQVLGRRTVAIIVDSIILLAIWALIALATGGVDNGDNGVRFETKTGGTLLFLLVFFLYFTLLEGGPGKTAGKVLLGIRVTNAEGGRAGFGRAAVRTLLRIIDVLPFCYGVGWISAMATGDERARPPRGPGRVDVRRALALTLPKRHEIKRIALTDPTDLDLPFATWSLAKLADYLVAEGVVTDISHEGLRQLLREEGVRFQAVRSWKRSNDPDFEAKRDRIVELYALAEAGEAVVICLDEFGPLNLQPQPGGKGWAPRAKPKRIRATYTRPHGVRHLISAYDVGADRLYGHVKQRKGRVEFLTFCRYVRGLYPPEIRLHFVLDNFSPHKGDQVRAWAAANNVELAYTPFYASWLNRIEAQFRALRYFTLAGTDHPDHATQARLIRRYIAWRNRNTDNPRLRALPSSGRDAAR